MAAKIPNNFSQIKVSKKAVNFFPKKPGVYFFLKKNFPIYIGKAANLRYRIKSYFDKNVLPKTRRMVSTAETFSFIPTQSELEAILLEAKLINFFQPKYNFIAKDDKQPLYIKITNDFYPRIIVVRKSDKTPSRHIFGPFPSSQAVKQVLKLIRQIFPYADHKLTRKPCFYSQIGLCNPCPNEIENMDNEFQKRVFRIQYLKQISYIKRTLSGKLNLVKKELIKEIKNEASKENYEKAGELKKKLDLLNYITQNKLSGFEYFVEPRLEENLRKRGLEELKKIIFDLTGQKINLHQIECFDISHTGGYLATGSRVVFEDGEANKNKYRRYRLKGDYKANDTRALAEIAKRRLKSVKTMPLPDLILVDGGKAQLAVFQKIICDPKTVILGIAKEFETLISKEKKYRLKPGPAKNLIVRIRDESHRFAQKYHHLLFKKSLFDKH